MPKVGLRDGPEGVALMHGVFGGGVERSDGSGQNQLRANFDVIGIAEAGIDGEKFMPAESIAEALGGELPERIARQDGDYR